MEWCISVEGAIGRDLKHKLLGDQEPPWVLVYIRFRVQFSLFVVFLILL